MVAVLMVQCPAPANGPGAICFSKRPTTTLLALRAESPHEIDDQGDNQNQAKAAAPNERTSKVKPAATEQEKKNH
jgi:hypothetical protein